ncbi:Zn-ribbon domain-containing OB-fold protein [Sphingobium phenoxybenzoativorans]|uniref:Zn-ribbon domain-containing OB-fold protein n=1 Tax=Sphingobium phenoxybenzoativorans TaxID=1592790 RepID=A0A975K955_9SPHN|nr:Zn-ribbon domain-containing OB-fold protein [Sphingobium phenoxybenzoativorans]QUT06767.1 Zn-ribbon domain-containing OB-fold protein [Sphingobium phenoxybenzoativorans]
MLANNAPLPVLTPETEAFWTGGREGKLMIMRCAQCTRRHHPPSPVCPHCYSERVAPEAVSGRAKIASFTVNHQKWLPDMKVPFVIAIVELDEQPDIRITTNIVNAPPETINIGQSVQVLFEQHDDVWLPLFQPEEGA